MVGMDEEELEEQETKEEQTGKRKALGIPELDPDALPSSHVSKFLNLDGNIILFNKCVLSPQFWY